MGRILDPDQIQTIDSLAEIGSLLMGDMLFINDKERVYFGSEEDEHYLVNQYGEDRVEQLKVRTNSPHSISPDGKIVVAVHPVILERTDKGYAKKRKLIEDLGLWQ